MNNTTAPGSTGPTAATTTPRQTTTVAAAPVTALTISNFTFMPSVLTLGVGAVVEATNLDGPTHTWTADDGTWDSKNLTTGKRFRHTFNAAGTFTYSCTIHPSMRGTVKVTG